MFLRTLSKEVPPGQKLCKKCWNNLNDTLTLHQDGQGHASSTGWKRVADNEVSSSESSASGMDEELSHSLNRNESLKRTNEVLKIIGKSPLTLKSKNKRQKTSYSVQKYQKARQNLSSNFSLAVGISDVEVGAEVNCEDQTAAQANTIKAHDLDIMMEELKEKMPTADRQKQFSILTLKPNSRSVSETEEYFGVSKYAVMKAMAIKQEKG